jgi:signal transduction histidine kinase
MPYTRVNDPEKLRRLLAAVLLIANDVELSHLLSILISEACSLVGARYGALGVLNEQRTGLQSFLTVGLDEEAESSIGARPTGRGVLGLLITDPRPMRLDRLSDHPDSYGFPPNHPPMSSFLGVPLRVRDEIFGNLYLTDKIGAERFTDEDEALAEALALATGIAIQNHRLQERVMALSVLDDRDRIARDLHDRVIQRIYAVGMSLAGAARLDDLPQVQDRVERAVDALDTTITDIRTAIFELGDSSIPGGLRDAVLHLTDELGPTLESRPEVRFVGPVDNLVPPHVADHLLAVIREALTNAAKYARATHLSVEISVMSDVVLVEIADNGEGFEVGPAASTGHGLTNMRNRAEKLSGSFELISVKGEGTRLVWSVPV